MFIGVSGELKKEGINKSEISLTYTVQENNLAQKSSKVIQKNHSNTLVLEASSQNINEPQTYYISFISQPATPPPTFS